MPRPCRRKSRPPIPLEKFAILLRKRMTKSEVFFWARLKKAQKDWKHKFIPDFYCDSLKLAIELDGSIHRVKSVKKHDSRRTKLLNRMGVTVIRYQNAQVFGNWRSIINQLKEVCYGVE
jgi:very-short-patch-repair endonuclease